MYLYCRKIEAQVLNCLALLNKHNNFIKIAFIISVLSLRLIKFHFYYNFFNLNNTTTNNNNNNNYMYMFNKRYSFLLCSFPCRGPCPCLLEHCCTMK